MQNLWKTKVFAVSFQGCDSRVASRRVGRIDLQPSCKSIYGEEAELLMSSTSSRIWTCVIHVYNFK